MPRGQGIYIDEGDDDESQRRRAEQAAKAPPEDIPDPESNGDVQEPPD